MRNFIITSLFILGFVFLTGCKHKKNKNIKFEEQLMELKNTKTYQDVQTSANASLNIWLADGLEDVQVLNDCYWKVDDAVFFNSKKDRCYFLLLIQDKDPNATLDYVYVLYGALDHDQWKIYFESLPNLVFPRERFNKDKKAPIPLETLSKAAREEVLRNYFKEDGSVNDQFVEKVYTEAFRQRHEAFLKKNQ